jgi:methyltransferase (TIGR00027 family)
VHQTLEGGAIFSDPFATKILDDETRARLDETAADLSLRPWRLFIAARSRFSEDTLAACVARGMRQIVVLGAGLDTFSLRNPHAGLGVRVFEVDYPATQGWKRERLKQAGLAVPVELAELLRQKGFGIVEDLGMAEIAERFYGALKQGIVIGPGAHVVRALKTH